MSNQKYDLLVGAVQQFGDKPVMVDRDVNGTTVREFTVKSAQRAPDGEQKLIRVSLWPEYAHVTVGRGDSVTVDGKLNVSQGKTQTFYSITAKTIAVTRAETPVRDETANASAPVTADAAPF